MRMELDLSRSLHKLTARLDRAADTFLRAEAGVSYARFLALYLVGAEGADTQRALADRLGVTEPSVSRMVRVLAEAGLLETTPDPLGGNRNRLRLTSAGERLVKRWGTDLEQRLARLLETAGVPYRPYLTHTKRLLRRARVAAGFARAATSGSIGAFRRSEQSMSTTMPRSSREVVRSSDGTEISYETVGVGDGLIVLGGAWRTSRDYLPLARALSGSFTVHVIDRRGRGHSGPQGADYSVAREVEDLLAVQAQTGAAIVFAHSYGGLVALETARQSTVFSDVIVYEPGVSIAGSIRLGWMDTYRERLAVGDSRGAFAAMMRGAGGAPPVVERMPLWYVKLVLRLFIRRDQWSRVEPLLEAGLVEHGEVAALDAPTADRYQSVAARVLLLGGGKSRWFAGTGLADHLPAAIPDCTSKLIEGVDHIAPEKAPELVAGRVLRHLRH